MSAPSPTLAWALLGLPLVLVVLPLLLGAVRWLRLRRRPRQEPEALLLGAVSRSLQERGELAASLGELRTVHERLLDALPSGLLWVDQRQRVAALNARGQGLLGVKAGVVGLDAGFVLEPFPWLLEGLARTPGEAWRCEGGGRRWMISRVEAPHMVGAILQFEDVTEREIEERRLQLRERFADLGEMTAGVAHQLKNGLAVLKGHGQLLARGGHEDVSRALLEETDALERVVQRFLQWARPLDPRPEDTDLQELAAQVAEEVRRRPAGRGRLVEVRGEGRAMADAMLLQQALLNLLENACEASPVGGRVEVEVAPGRIRILDGGPGMDPGTLARMLKPFESGRADGTGLGLPLALKWLNAQGAELTFAPRAEGGTLAEVRWW